jgi:hypothetical protein
MYDSELRIERVRILVYKHPDLPSISTWRSVYYRQEGRSAPPHVYRCESIYEKGSADWRELIAAGFAAQLAQF